MKTKTIIILIALVSLILFILLKARQCNNNEYDAINWKARYDSLKVEFVTFKNKAGQQVIEQKPAVFADAEAVKKASAKAFNLKKKDERKIKKVMAFVKVEQEVAISNDSISISTEFEGIEKSDSIAVPVAFVKDTGDYYMEGHITKTHLVIDSMSIYNTISMRIAEKKKGVFKKGTVVQVVNTNPLLVNRGIQSTIVNHKPTAWSKWVKPALVAVVTGVLTYKLVK